MVETGNFFEEYARMSPRELNEEFRRILNLIPKAIAGENAGQLEVDEIDLIRESKFSRALEMEFVHSRDLKAMVDLIRRERSETLFILSSRLNQLLVFAATTSSFRDRFSGEFKDLYLSGRESAGRNLEFLLDSDRSESGGIFEQKRAKEIERFFYRRLTRDYLHFRAELLSMESLSEEGLISLDQLGQPLRTWRQKFIDRHGEEP